MHSEITTGNKQTDKGWVCAESLLQVTGSSGKYLSIPANDNLEWYLDRSFSFSIIVTQKTGSGTQVLLNNRLSTDTSSKGYSFYFFDTGALGVEFSDGTALRSGSKFLPTINTKNFLLTVTYSGSSKILSFYVNGKFVDIIDFSAYSINPYSGNPLKIGSYVSGGESISYTGHLGFLSWYNKVLTSFEVEQLYSDISIIPKSLHHYCVGFWTMQERTGDKAYDAVEQFNYSKYGDLNSLGRGSFPPYDEFDYNETTGVFTSRGDGVNFQVLVSKKLFAPVAGVIYNLELEVFSIDYQGVDGADLLKVFAFGKVGVVNDIGLLQIQYIVGDSQEYPTLWNYPFEVETRGFKGTFGNIKLTVQGYEEDIKLAGNHADLIGYTATELGTDTNETTQTAKVDFYTKTVTDRTNGSGIDLKSGLPELKNALKMINTRDVPYPRNSAITGIGTGNFSLVYSCYVSNFTSNDRLLYLRGSGVYVDIYKDKIQILPDFTATSLFFGYIPSEGSFKGFNTFVINRTSLTTWELYINGVRKSLGGLVVAQDGYGGLDTVTGGTGSLAGLNNTSFPAYNDYYPIFLGIKSEPLTDGEIVNLNNNTLFSNPTSMRNWKMYYQMGNIISTNVVTDHTGLNGNITLSTLSADELNPAHADYAIKTINSLR